MKLSTDDYVFQITFSFSMKKGNVANQREHLIMLLANMHGRLIPKQASTPEVSLPVKVLI